MVRAMSALIPTRAGAVRTRLLALPEARWAIAATAAFLLALPLQLLGSSAWLWGPLYAAAYVAGGWEPALEGLRALREKTLDVDLLMIVAALGAAAIGQVMDGALLIVIFATSGAVEALATARTEDSVRGLLDLAPPTATRLRPESSTEETVAAAELAIGDIVVVRPGERVGADGRVLDGASEIDQATITGEPLPVPKAAGDEVFAGTLNGTGALRVRVERDPSDSVIARVVALVEEASRTKAPTQLFVERIEHRYALGMVAATVLVFAVPLAFGAQLTDALLRAMTFMIVASPCAVVLATMPPLLSAIANAGRHGVLIKSAAVMERLGQADTIAYDKTGTLTEGTPHLIKVIPEPAFSENELLALAASAEHRSEHPIARAIVAAARDLACEEAYDFRAEPGRGVTATVGGREVTVGSPEHFGEQVPGASHVPGAPDTPDGAAVPDGAAAPDSGGTVPDSDSSVPDSDGTAVVVRVDGVRAGWLLLADRLRSGAPTAVAEMNRLTTAPPALLTGDNRRAAHVVAEQTGIPSDGVRAGLLPHEKSAAVGRLNGNVLFIGDGVNDAPALAAAHTGIAMGRRGSDLALETADAVLVHDDLTAVPKAVALSRRARRLVVQNLCIAGVFITGLVIWDLAGHLPLPLGVAGHEGSTILVGLNGLRLLRERAWLNS
ncbi:cadmium-translocating P-type ATPase [Streptomyces sporangiiformans]|uniref:Cadmium-translocating P-type ATPase n=2 Tax=Streptomyces sporangiiformans TaxID=2315329 RepID=A0A505D7H9_9ACTN|nr:cadmium-translocating P-type ATPase [Streptomyces sporangiiformans]